MYVAWLATVEQRCGELWGRNRAAEFRIGGCYRGQPGPQEAGVSVCEPKAPGAAVMLATGCMCPLDDRRTLPVCDRGAS